MIGITQPQKFSKEFKLKIIKEVLSGQLSKEEARRKYNLKGKTPVLNWMRKFGIDQSCELSEELLNSIMSEEHQSQQDLQKRIKELEKALEDATLKAEAYSTLIDVAERELNIKIRKKSSTKPSKK